jgi:hypothetical protein
MLFHIMSYRKNLLFETIANTFYSPPIKNRIDQGGGQTRAPHLLYRTVLTSTFLTYNVLKFFQFLHDIGRDMLV